MWAGALGNTVFLYALYTVVHEAVHSNTSSRRKNLRWIDPVAGIIACAPLWLNYHQHKRQHMAHHAHTNEETDPDIYARGSFLGWIFLRLPVALLNYFNPVQQYRDCQRFNCTRREYVYTALSFSAHALIVLGLLAAGYWREVLFLWFVPWWIGQTAMLTFFTWTPHHDHHETGRYRNTRRPPRRPKSATPRKAVAGMPGPSARGAWTATAWHWTRWSCFLPMTRWRSCSNARPTKYDSRSHQDRRTPRVYGCRRLQAAGGALQGWYALHGHGRAIPPEPHR
jgi:hypothetical protein